MSPSSTHTDAQQPTIQQVIGDMTRRIRATPDGQRKFFDPQRFPWVTEIESEWRTIRRELDALLAALDLLPGFEELSAVQRHVSDDRRWKVFPLYAYGNWMKQNEARCPETSRIVRLIPGLRAAMFSIFQAGKALPPHEGTYCGVLRYHLGLKVPKPEEQCGVDVGGEVAHWHEGRSLIFDDTFTHAAWNRSREDRVVLFVDFVRPLAAPLAAANEHTIDRIGRSHFMDEIRHAWDEWESRHGRQFEDSRHRMLPARIGQMEDSAAAALPSESAPPL
jgi:ornithine lipid ester-linked acyl 2-hydroxylase